MFSEMVTALRDVGYSRVMSPGGTVLVTGAAGYIGSHTCVSLLRSGWNVVGIDNLSNSKATVIARISELAARDLEFREADVRDRAALQMVFDEYAIDSVIHFAGKKAVGESTEIPLSYYSNNLAGTLQLAEVMQEAGVRNIIFSSSCTVYGEQTTLPVTERSTLSAASPYGRTKLFVEDMLRDLAQSESGWRVFLLRYFNPVGAHPSGRLGEDPLGTPNNLMPLVMQAATGRRAEVVVFGDDWPTPDGTCVRDYIHVEDVAEGHVAALEKLDSIEGCVALNLGTGTGSSVLEVLAAASTAVGRAIPYRVGPRRSGDVAATWADVQTAESLLGWRASRSLADMCQDHWRWQSENPDGY
jgi:UDP-glucose 4-epimerase